MPNLILLAGPNGSGKSTFAQTALRDIATFDLKIDADEIAREIDSRDPASVAFSAGRDALHLREQSLKDGLSVVNARFQGTASVCSKSKSARLSNTFHLSVYFNAGALRLPSQASSDERRTRNFNRKYHS